MILLAHQFRRILVCVFDCTFWSSSSDCLNIYAVISVKYSSSIAYSIVSCIVINGEAMHQQQSESERRKKKRKIRFSIVHCAGVYWNRMRIQPRSSHTASSVQRAVSALRCCVHCCLPHFGFALRRMWPCVWVWCVVLATETEFTASATRPSTEQTTSYESVVSNMKRILFYVIR